MRLIYNDALNKRVLPYLERLTKKKSNLDKETCRQPGYPDGGTALRQKSGLFHRRHSRCQSLL